MRAEKPETWHIGVIGGSGLAGGIALEDAQEIAVSSPFGAPSGPVTLGRIGEVRFTFIARHGAGHTIPPDSVNYRANIDVLKRCGVTDVLALSAIGSLREDFAPGHFVAADQVIDRTGTARKRSFFGPGLVAHVGLADPVCPRLCALAAEAAQAAGGTVHRGGCYVAIEGPQFSTRAESRMYRNWGADVIGMTGFSEARLAREAELCYASLAMVTDYDCWHDSHGAVDVAQVIAVVHANAAAARGLVARLPALMDPDRQPCPHGCDRALSHAIMTAPDKRDPEVLGKLAAVAARIL